MSKAIDVSDATFAADVLDSPVPVLVDYWAAWCGPCRMIAPLISESAESYAGRLTVAKVNVDDSPAAPSRYRVRSIPTLMIFKGGVPVATHVGGLSKARLTEWIHAHVGADESGAQSVKSA